MNRKQKEMAIKEIDEMVIKTLSTINTIKDRLGSLLYLSPAEYGVVNHHRSLLNKRTEEALGHLRKANEALFLLRNEVEAMDVAPAPNEKEICPACNGSVHSRIGQPIDSPFSGSDNRPSSDVIGQCGTCGAYKMVNNPRHWAAGWCRCAEDNINHNTELRYYWNDKGHGWLHTKCGNIVQVG